MKFLVTIDAQHTTPSELVNFIIVRCRGWQVGGEPVKVEHVPDHEHSILQPWVMRLPLRYQGVLITSVRGCDGLPKHSGIKPLVREMRGLCLEPADERELAFRKGFMSKFDQMASGHAFIELLNDMDSMNLHYVLHLVHAIEVLGYCHPYDTARDLYQLRYKSLCHKMHVKPENHTEMDERLREDRVQKGTVEQ